MLVLGVFPRIIDDSIRLKIKRITSERLVTTNIHDQQTSRVMKRITKMHSLPNTIVSCLLLPLLRVRICDFGVIQIVDR